MVDLYGLSKWLSEGGGCGIPNSKRRKANDGERYDLNLTTMRNFLDNPRG